MQVCIQSTTFSLKEVLKELNPCFHFFVVIRVLCGVCVLFLVPTKQVESPVFYCSLVGLMFMSFTRWQN